MKHLWEISHPYYCNHGNYFSNGCVTHFESWPEFIESEGNSDLDMNLVFRFDWKGPTNEDGEPVAHHYAENYPEDELWLFYMGQRKGLYRSVQIKVCRADEPSVIEWLKTRWDYLKVLWEPLV